MRMKLIHQASSEILATPLTFFAMKCPRISLSLLFSSHIALGFLSMDEDTTGKGQGGYKCP